MALGDMKQQAGQKRERHVLIAVPLWGGKKLVHRQRNAISSRSVSLRQRYVDYNIAKILPNALIHWRKLHRGELQNMNSLPNIVQASNR
jgi:hypothetical protein